MNVADSERMAGVLEAAGYICAPDPAAADVLVYNTCSIREKAEVKVYSALGKQVRQFRWGCSRLLPLLEVLVIGKQLHGCMDAAAESCKGSLASFQVVSCCRGCWSHGTE